MKKQKSTVIEKDTPMNFWDATFIVVNKYLEDMNRLQKKWKIPNGQSIHDLVDTKFCINAIVNMFVQTLDETKAPIQDIKAMALNVIEFHRERGDLYTISHVIFGGAKDGQAHWTAV